jgi:hypothetical protein
MSEQDVERTEYKTAWWEGGSQDRILKMRKDQPTTDRITLYEVVSDPVAIEKLVQGVDPAAVVELPPEQYAFQDLEAHDVGVERGVLTIRRIVGVGSTTVGWETIAIFPAGTWQRCEAIKFREAEKGS